MSEVPIGRISWLIMVVAVYCGPVLSRCSSHHTTSLLYQLRIVPVTSERVVLVHDQVVDVYQTVVCCGHRLPHFVTSHTSMY